VDVESGKWTRLYPIPFRDLDEDRKFRKYAIVEASVRTTSKDRRPESREVNVDSIRPSGFVDTKNKWERRKAMVLPTLSGSFCEILRKQNTDGLSMGAFRPGEVDFGWTKASVRDCDRRQACYAQLSFLNPTRQALEPVPYNFRYHFKCLEEPACPGHDIAIIDWELSAAWYHWRTKYPDVDQRLMHIRHNWLEVMCGADRDTVFFVGNHRRFRDIFMVGGVFYPPR